jgi:hypothetical protein
MANPERKQLFTGARARLIANGVRVGWATGVSGSRSYQKEPVDVLDNVEVEEHATLGYRVSLRASIVGLVSQSLVSAGLLPEIGQTNEEHLRNLIGQPVFTVQIEDNQTGAVIWEFTGCEIADESFSVQSRSMMMRDVNFVAIRLADVAET